ncbi:14115_t:CDS:2, partial [Acaulospora colombiana]
GFKLMKVPLEEARKRIVIADWNEGFPSTDLPHGFTMLSEMVQVGKLEQEAAFDGRYANETCLMCYSSGTTGLAKGVETTHKNLVSIMCMFPSVFIKLEPGKDRMLGFLPGLVKVLLYPISKGGASVLIRGFDVPMFGAALNKYKVTILPMIPPVILLLAKNPIFEKFDFSGVKLITSGAAPLGADLTFEVTERLRKLGSKALVVQGYGLTETSPTVHYNPAQHWDTKAGTVGPLLPNIEARLVQDDGEDAPEGGRGELWLRGPSIMKGYLHNATATVNSITPDGWFQTGDIAIVDKDGTYQVQGIPRLANHTNMVLLAILLTLIHPPVPPADLEAVLISHPDVVDSGVIGVYSKRQETELPRWATDPKEVEAFQKAVSKWITTKTQFQRGQVACCLPITHTDESDFLNSAAGKILRKELRERAKKEIELEGEPDRAKL